MRRLAVLLLVLLVIAGLLAFLFSSKQPETIQINKPLYMLATNIQQPAIVGGQLDFFTGSSFAKFNPATGRSQPLSDYLYTQGAITVSSWSEHAVVFSTAGTGSSDTFGHVLLAAGRNSTASAWWRYDFRGRQLELLNFKAAPSCNYINEIGANLWCFAPDNGSAHATILYSYNLNSHVQKDVTHISSPVSSVSAVGGSLYYVTTDLAGAQTLRSYSTASGSGTTLYKSKQQLSYATNGRQLLMDELPAGGGPAKNNTKQTIPTTNNVAGHQLLQLLDIPTGKTKKLSVPGGSGQFANVSGRLSFTGPGGRFYAADTDNIKTYQIDGPNVGSAWQAGGITYYLDSGNNLFANKRLPVLKNPTNFIEKDNVSPNNFYINVFSGTSSTVYLNNAAKTFAGNAADVAGFLAAHGYDPDQFNFDWQILSATDAAGVTSNSVILN